MGSNTTEMRESGASADDEPGIPMKREITDPQEKAFRLRFESVYAKGKYPSGTVGCLCEFDPGDIRATYCHRDKHVGDPLHVHIKDHWFHEGPLTPDDVIMWVQSEWNEHHPKGRV